MLRQVKLKHECLVYQSLKKNAPYSSQQLNVAVRHKTVLAVFIESIGAGEKVKRGVGWRKRNNI